MSLFLITFLSLYGGMHAYAFVRLRGLVPLPSWGTAVLAFWMLLMTFAPIATRLAERAGQEKGAWLIAWPGYTWMGFIFLFASFQAGGDLLRLSCRLLGRITGGIGTPAPQSVTVIALTAAFAAACYASWEANRIRTDSVTITTSRLPGGVARLRVVQVSDVHVGLLMSPGRLQRIAAAVREARPDLIVSTGDLVDGRLGHDEQMILDNGMAGILAALEAPLGKFAVTGNHEVYAGLRESAIFSRAAGFTLLRDQTVTLPAGISICGVDDPAGRPGRPVAAPDEAGLLRQLPPHTFRLLLKHRPTVPPDSDGRFDLQLSGHVHKGQLFPFNLLVRLAYHIPCGTTRTPGGSLIHVSRGSGTWGPTMRLLAPPEVTVIDLVKSPAD